MKTIFNISIAFTLLLYFNCVNAQDAWVKKADFGGAARNFGAAFSIGNKAYFGTGGSFDKSSVYYNDFWEYDPGNNSWTQKSSFGFHGRAGAVGFSIGKKGYVGTAWTPGNDFWEYDTSNDSWTPIAGLPAAGRIGGIGFSIGNKGYAGLGEDINGNYLKDFWQYDTTLDEWIQKADYPGQGLFGDVGFSIGNKGFVGSGENAGGSTEKDFWEYDTTNDKWIQRTNIGGMDREDGVGFCIANMGYVGFGYVGLKFSGKIANDMWAYDTSSNKWTQMTSCDTSYITAAPTAFVIGNKAYLTCGADNHNKFRKDTWQYTNHTAGINVPESRIELVVYPNPNSGNFIIKGIPNSSFLEITNIEGKLVYQCTNHSVSNTINIDLELDNGIYILKVLNNEGVIVDKFIVNQ